MTGIPAPDRSAGDSGEILTQRVICDHGVARPEHARRVGRMRRDHCCHSWFKAALFSFNRECYFSLKNVPHLFLLVIVFMKIGSPIGYVPVGERHVF